MMALMGQGYLVFTSCVLGKYQSDVKYVLFIAT